MDWPLFVIGMNDTWRRGRKMLNGSLRPVAITSYRQMMQDRTREFLAQVRSNPGDFRAHLVL